MSDLMYTFRNAQNKDLMWILVFYVACVGFAVYLNF
jgi:hypothetical protein